MTLLRTLGVANLCCLLAAPASRAATVIDSSTTQTLHPAPGQTVQTTTATRKSIQHGKTTTSHSRIRRVVIKKLGQVTTHVTRTAHTITIKAAPGRHPHGITKAIPKPLPPIVAAVAPPPKPPEPDSTKGTDSGLPLPRFAALRSDQVSFRAGPGTRYPIDWVYQRRDLPVKIEREFEVWRLVSEPDGTRGWVHEAMLTGRRGFLITSDQPQTLRAAASDGAPAVAIVKPGVVGRLLVCPAEGPWCEVQVKTYRGYLNRAAFWGTLPAETVGP